ncbi:hypothetical protein [Anatilimnocola floriformis]|uniref:hypothetical protein n=1 Tax=Anatilimnocola floriformis TaxID=2948575 RepID=UPI0020C33060|nr:hypothetical protein [Anatilimnocola floriformis]
MDTPHAAKTAPLKAASQYSLRSLLVTMFTASMVLAYVRLFGDWAMIAATTGFFATLVIGIAVGWISGRLASTLTWAVVCYALILCSMLSSYRLDQIQVVYWLTIAALIGTIAGVAPAGQIGYRLISGCGFWLLAGSILWLRGDLSELWIDWLLTLLVAVGLLLLVEVVDRLQKQYHTALDVWAAGLVFAVIAGNFGAILVWNLWYV